MNPLIVALDVPTLDEARSLTATLQSAVGHIKIGLELFAAAGPDSVTELGEQVPVFLDLKLHDIPTTVERAARRLAQLGVALATVHASGGRDMIAAAVEGFTDGTPPGRPAPQVLAVTVLTSLSDQDLGDVGQPKAADQVPALAALALEAGAAGIVCAPRDLERVRAQIGTQPLLVTPGIRPSGTDHADHARAMTPAEAISAGATHLVVGRPITRAQDPRAAAHSILQEVAA